MHSIVINVNICKLIHKSVILSMCIYGTAFHLWAYSQQPCTANGTLLSENNENRFSIALVSSWGEVFEFRWGFSIFFGKDLLKISKLSKFPRFSKLSTIFKTLHDFRNSPKIFDRWISSQRLIPFGTFNFSENHRVATPPEKKPVEFSEIYRNFFDFLQAFNLFHKSSRFQQYLLDKFEFLQNVQCLQNF